MSWGRQEVMAMGWNQAAVVSRKTRLEAEVVATSCLRQQLEGSFSRGKALFIIAYVIG